MSLIVTVKTAEGIVMAADSRVSMRLNKDGEPKIAGISHYTDHFNKIFVAPNGMGLSFCGEMAIEQGNLSTIVEAFLKNQITVRTPSSVVPTLLLNFMTGLPQVPKTIFHLCGYEEGKAQIWRVIPSRGSVEEIAGKPLLWDGEGDVLARLLSPAQIRTADGPGPAFPDHPVAVNFFTLQDAVDFADFAIDVTKRTMAFQLRPKTVGGDIDILVVRPDDTTWVRKKTLGEPK